MGPTFKPSIRRRIGLSCASVILASAAVEIWLSPYVLSFLK